MSFSVTDTLTFGPYVVDYEKRVVLCLSEFVVDADCIIYGDYLTAVVVQEHRKDIATDKCLSQSTTTITEQSPTLIVGEPCGYLVVGWRPLRFVSDIVAKSLHESFASIRYLNARCWWIGIETTIG